VVAEILLGITLLLGFLPKITLWLLLLMIVFFTFLTFYSAYFNKVTDCGCFGDAIPLTPWESFYKDVILLVMILVLFFNLKKIKPIVPPKVSMWVTAIAGLASLFFGYYVLMHLPALDFRAYKLGKNILKQMEPDPSKPAVYEYVWKFEHNGNTFEKITTGDFPQVDGELIDYETRLVDPGYVPPILDFSITGDNDNDYTKDLMNEPKLLIIVAYNLNKSEAQGWEKIRDKVDEARKKGYIVIGLTASGIEDQTFISSKFKFPLDFYFTDETVLKTMVRSNPGLMLLNSGTITQKWHWNDAEKLKL
ncbi:MAG: DoxX family protein, partial [Flavobacteriaceae bacterium]|nr:DoxX family protein [Flavobacteriaceae bacterium]